MKNAKLKLGDTVTAEYGDTTVTGIIEGFSHGWIMLKLEKPVDLGYRIAEVGLGIRPCDRHTVKLVKSGPEVTESDIVTLEPGNFWLRSGVPAALASEVR